MKYGVNLMVWTTHVGGEHESLLFRVREWGFDGVELFLSPEEPVDIPLLTQVLSRVGLQRTTCTVLPRDAHLPSPDSETHLRALEYLNRCVERTAQLEATPYACMPRARRSARAACPNDAVTPKRFEHE